jgi:glycosyltransferase involved in cell wall biosynthesis
MRIAVVHSYYGSHQPSGENAVVELQVAALRRDGHEVLEAVQATDIRAARPGYQLRAALTVATGFGPSPMEDLARFRPDIVHVHNLFPNYGLSWLERAARIAPVVVTLHNYRMACSVGTFFRDGHDCRDCVVYGARSAVRHACYRGSRVATLPVALSTRRNVGRHRLVRDAAAVVALTDGARADFVELGVPPHRLSVIPNFVETPAIVPVGLSDVWLYAGRLAAEKGVDKLLDAWPPGRRLHLAGSGPLAPEAQVSPLDSVTFLGRLTRAELLDKLPTYRGLLLPSVWREGLPTILLEAAARGVPIVAARPSYAASVVAEACCGVVMPQGWRPSDLEDALDAIDADRVGLSERGKIAFHEQWSESAWLERISSLYERVLTA